MNQRSCLHLFQERQLLNISPTNHIYTETFYSEFYSGVWLIDQNSVPLDIEDRISMTLAINDVNIL